MRDNADIDVLLSMLTATHQLVLGLSGLLYEVLPRGEGYKVEVLLETYTDTLEGLGIDSEGDRR
jgi:hypothetical protein